MEVDAVAGVAPRWVLPGFFFNPEDSNKNTSVIAFLGDSVAENKYGAGRVLKLPPLDDKGAYVMNSAINAVELKTKEFGFRLDIIRYLRELGLVNQTNSTTKLDDRQVIRLFVA